MYPKHFYLAIVSLIGLMLTGCDATSPFEMDSSSVSIMPQTSPATPSLLVETKPSAARYLVLVSIDACRPDYLSISQIPNIKKLMNEGVSYSNAWVGQLRNNTPPGHVTMATGAFPSRSRVPCFVWRDSSRQTGVVNLQRWDIIISGELNRIIGKSGCTSIGSIYKKANPGARVAAISSDKFFAAASLGAESADYILFNRNVTADAAKQAGNDLQLVGVVGKLAPAEIMRDPIWKRNKLNRYDGDTWATDVALKLFEREKPEILLLNLPETDHSGHQTGGITAPRIMSEVVTNADRQIGRLMDAYKAAGVYDKTVWVITSDHGMTPTDKIISQSEIDNIITLSGTRALFNSNEPLLVNPAKAPEVAENIAVSGIPGIQGTYFRQKKADGSFTFIPSPTTARNITGDLDKCYRYLGSTYASIDNPDVMIVEAENWRQTTNYPGSHDTFTWLNQYVPLVMAGPGVRQNVISESPARLADIAPTVLTLMGLRAENMDGIVLADAVINASDKQLDTQKNLNEVLLPMTRALKARSEADLEALK